MTEVTKDDLATFAAILEEFAASQRAAALLDTRKQRITVARHVGDTNIAFETVVDEGQSAEDIFKVLEPLDGAIDRLKAKSDLSDHYARMANHAGQIEMTVNKLASDVEMFRQQNAKLNERRREPVVWSGVQIKTLDGHRAAIDESFARIDELKAAAAECRRVLAGEDPFKVIEEQIAARLDKLRGARQAAA